MKKIEIPSIFKVKSIEYEDGEIIKALIECANAINELIDKVEQPQKTKETVVDELIEEYAAQFYALGASKEYTGKEYDKALKDFAKELKDLEEE